MLIILGDFNAKIGATTLDDHARSAVGRFGIGERNKREKNYLNLLLITHSGLEIQCFSIRSDTFTHGFLLETVIEIK